VVAAGAVTLSKYGGISTNSTAQSTTASLQANALTPEQASRFLSQATNGATRAEIDALVASGIDSWLDSQFSMPRTTSHWDWLTAAGYGDPGFQKYIHSWDYSVWRQLIAAPDQLRQRVSLALLDILVVSIDGLVLNWKHFAMAGYMDLLLDHAFDNYRSLLGAITTNAAMASFLTFLNNRKAQQGSHPDENYARELMQLFTIGLHILNVDGTEVIGSDGNPIETYSQTDVSQLARVFTGLGYFSNDGSTPDHLREPLVMRVRLNERGPSTFLGHTVHGGGMAAINAALDVIFAHPNVPPFVSRSLIQRLITSNPTPAYVARVAAIFADNGQGVRGDLRAVVRAILTDTEARDLPMFPSANTTKLRDPVQRFTNWARAFKASSASGRWLIGDLSEPATKLGQSPGHSPSVFNFFRPRYSPPNTAISDAHLVAPEFQITSEESVIGYVNFMNLVVTKGIGGDVTADYSDMMALASDGQALVNEVNLILAAGQLSGATLNTIQTAVESVSLSSPNCSEKRVFIAALLALSSPDFIALN